MSENKPVLIALVVTGLLLIGIAVYYGTSSEDDAPVVSDKIELPDSKPIEPEIKVPTPEPEPIADPEPVVENTQPEPPAFILPRLDSSDQLIRDGAVSLTRHEGINTWLGSNQLIRKIVAFTDNVSNGTIAKEPAAALAPRGQMSVVEIEEGVYQIHERSFERFNGVTNILVTIETERAIEFYLLLRPLFQEAYKELGYPSGHFDQVILRAIGRLLETPRLDAPARLIRPVVMYEYEDPQLEDLSPAQKQLLRMGPKNASAVKDKLRDFARELRSALE